MATVQMESIKTKEQTNVTVKKTITQCSDQNNLLVGLGDLTGN